MRTPFFHEEIEVKKRFLEIARDFANSSDIEKELASALLYANMSEYLAYHLLESLKQTVFSGSKAFWNGNVYLDARDTSEKLTIGQIAQELKRYGFPSKELIIPLLRRITTNRNKIMHNMLRLPASEMGQIDTAITELVQDSEQLVNSIDDIYRGLPPSNITQVTDTKATKPEVEAVENEQGEVTVQEKESKPRKKSGKNNTG
jgi:hypothetical protein